jgi:hypothetical protein
MRPWLDLLTEKAYSPTWRRNVLITKRQWRLLARTFSGRRTTQRELASGLGYSVGGLNAALESLVTLGLGIKRTRLGCKGWTFFAARTGVLNANVQQQGVRTSKGLTPVSLLVNIPPPAPPVARMEGPPGDDGPSIFRRKMQEAGLVGTW